jgi:hypothetical protein
VAFDEKLMNLVYRQQAYKMPRNHESAFGCHSVIEFKEETAK